MQRADTVYLRESRSHIIQRVGREVANDSTRHWLLVQGSPMDMNAVNQTLDEHEHALLRCARVLDAPALESHAIAYQLLRELGLED